MKKGYILVFSFLMNLLIGIYLLNWQEDSCEKDYNKIYVGSIIEEPMTAKAVGDIYFDKFLQDVEAFDKRNQFTSTVMFDKDTCEWVVVYLPTYDRPIVMLSDNPEDYPYEVRLRKDHGMVRITGYDFVYYLY